MLDSKFNEDDLTFMVPTKGRLHRRACTLEALKHLDLLHMTVLVCPYNEVEEWKKRFPGLTVAQEANWIKHMGHKRQWMFENCPTKLMMMMDDDLSFSNQYEENGERSTSTMEHDPDWMRYCLTEYLCYLFSKYDSVGLGSRPYANTRPMLIENRMIGGWAWGYNRELVYEDLKPAFARLQTYIDTDWCLTLLEAGHTNITFSHVLISDQGEASSPEDGGFGAMRTPEFVQEQFDKFMSLHPDSVSPNNRRKKDRPDTTQLGKFIVHWKRFK